jgi:uncharacterized protein (DUF2147 family)
MRSGFWFGLIAAVSVAGAAHATSPIEGRWLTPVQHGVIEITACGETICGHVVSSDHIKSDPGLKDSHNKDAALRDRPVKGLTMLAGFTGGPKEWKGGTAYNPDDGNTYKGSLTLADPNTLKVTGCVVFPLCKTQTWTRAN